jgi:CMP-N,N'-diacetyllegionaminic acid synthase
METSNKQILAIIPARGGSKGVPKKNIFPLAGKPLLVWTIEAAQKSKMINRIVVSSDDEGILQIALKSGAEPIRRPKSIAGDKAPFNLLIFHALDYLKRKEKYIPNIIVYLQPTSPLREGKDIDQALSLLKEKVTSIISVYEIDNKFLKSFIINKKGFLQGFSNNQFAFMNRQDLPKIYMPDGAIYAVKTGNFLKTGKLLTDKTIPFVMNLDKCLDIDTIKDLKKAEKILKTQLKKNK